ncbi:unnamed protein product [Bursaphelenchus xylophilus]|uniref:(pine wood nematode) hypothetical protein n=1 Tax=Bursaphelenchus xylophilus TaxID=6326 RepID=A0A1I7S595_BURXY|nr:unnamed protein product [Bursaphelenchus xylophilus]CAG9117837.1 unnamed protein product [Bursaphelenchus xylophilus]
MARPIDDPDERKFQEFVEAAGDSTMEASSVVKSLDDRIRALKADCKDTEQLLELARDAEERNWLIYRLQRQRLLYARYNVRKVGVLKKLAQSGKLHLPSEELKVSSAMDLTTDQERLIEAHLQEQAASQKPSSSTDTTGHRQSWNEYFQALAHRLYGAAPEFDSTIQICDSVVPARRFYRDAFADHLQPQSFDDETDQTVTSHETIVFGNAVNGASADAIVERRDRFRDKREVNDDHIRYIHEHIRSYRLETVLNRDQDAQISADLKELFEKDPDLFKKYYDLDEFEEREKRRRVEEDRLRKYKEGLEESRTRYQDYYLSGDSRGYQRATIHHEKGLDQIGIGQEIEKIGHVGQEIGHSGHRIGGIGQEIGHRDDKYSQEVHEIGQEITRSTKIGEIGQDLRHPADQVQYSDSSISQDTLHYQEELGHSHYDSTSHHRREVSKDSITSVTDSISLKFTDSYGSDEDSGTLQYSSGGTTPMPTLEEQVQQAPSPEPDVTTVTEVGKRRFDVEVEETISKVVRKKKAQIVEEDTDYSYLDDIEEESETSVKTPVFVGEPSGTGEIGQEIGDDGSIDDNGQEIESSEQIGQKIEHENIGQHIEVSTDIGQGASIESGRLLLKDKEWRSHPFDEYVHIRPSTSHYHDIEQVRRETRSRTSDIGQQIGQETGEIGQEIERVQIEIEHSEHYGHQHQQHEFERGHTHEHNHGIGQEIGHKVGDIGQEIERVVHESHHHERAEIGHEIGQKIGDIGQEIDQSHHGEIGQQIDYHVHYLYYHELEFVPLIITLDRYPREWYYEELDERSVVESGRTRYEIEIEETLEKAKRRITRELTQEPPEEEDEEEIGKSGVVNRRTSSLYHLMNRSTDMATIPFHTKKPIQWSYDEIGVGQEIEQSHVGQKIGDIGQEIGHGARVGSQSDIGEEISQHEETYSEVDQIHYHEERETHYQEERDFESERRSSEDFDESPHGDIGQEIGHRVEEIGQQIEQRSIEFEHEERVGHQHQKHEFEREHTHEHDYGIGQEIEHTHLEIGQEIEHQRLEFGEEIRYGEIGQPILNREKIGQRISEPVSTDIGQEIKTGSEDLEQYLEHEVEVGQGAKIGRAEVKESRRSIGDVLSPVGGSANIEYRQRRSPIYTPVYLLDILEPQVELEQSIYEPIPDVPTTPIGQEIEKIEQEIQQKEIGQEIEPVGGELPERKRHPSRHSIGQRIEYFEKIGQEIEKPVEKPRKSIDIGQEISTRLPEVKPISHVEHGRLLLRDDEWITSPIDWHIHQRPSTSHYDNIDDVRRTSELEIGQRIGHQHYHEHDTIEFEPKPTAAPRTPRSSSIGQEILIPSKIEERIERQVERLEEIKIGQEIEHEPVIEHDPRYTETPIGQRIEHEEHVYEEIGQRIERRTEDVDYHGHIGQKIERLEHEPLYHGEHEGHQHQKHELARELERHGEIGQEIDHRHIEIGQEVGHQHGKTSHKHEEIGQEILVPKDEPIHYHEHTTIIYEGHRPIVPKYPSETGQEIEHRHTEIGQEIERSHRQELPQIKPPSPELPTRYSEHTTIKWEGQRRDYDLKQRDDYGIGQKIEEPREIPIYDDVPVEREWREVGQKIEEGGEIGQKIEKVEELQRQREFEWTWIEREKRYRPIPRYPDSEIGQKIREDHGIGQKIEEPREIGQKIDKIEVVHRHHELEWSQYENQRGYLPIPTYQDRGIGQRIEEPREIPIYEVPPTGSQYDIGQKLEKIEVLHRYRDIEWEIYDSQRGYQPIPRYYDGGIGQRIEEPREIPVYEVPPTEIGQSIEKMEISEDRLHYHEHETAKWEGQRIDVPTYPVGQRIERHAEHEEHQRHYDFPPIRPITPVEVAELRYHEHTTIKWDGEHQKFDETEDYGIGQRIEEPERLEERRQSREIGQKIEPLPRTVPIYEVPPTSDIGQEIEKVENLRYHEHITINYEGERRDIPRHPSLSIGQEIEHSHGEIGQKIDKVPIYDFPPLEPLSPVKHAETRYHEHQTTKWKSERTHYEYPPEDLEHVRRDNSEYEVPPSHGEIGQEIGHRHEHTEEIYEEIYDPSDPRGYGRRIHHEEHEGHQHQVHELARGRRDIDHEYVEHHGEVPEYREVGQEIEKEVEEVRYREIGQKIKVEERYGRIGEDVEPPKPVIVEKIHYEHDLPIIPFEPTHDLLPSTSKEVLLPDQPYEDVPQASEADTIRRESHLSLRDDQDAPVLLWRSREFRASFLEIDPSAQRDLVIEDRKRGILTDPVKRKAESSVIRRRTTIREDYGPPKHYTHHFQYADVHELKRSSDELGYSSSTLSSSKNVKEVYDVVLYRSLEMIYVPLVIEYTRYDEGLQNAPEEAQLPIGQEIEREYSDPIGQKVDLERQIDDFGEKIVLYDLLRPLKDIEFEFIDKSEYREIYHRIHYTYSYYIEDSDEIERRHRRTRSSVIYDDVPVETEHQSREIGGEIYDTVPVEQEDLNKRSEVGSGATFEPIYYHEPLGERLTDSLPDEILMRSREFSEISYHPEIEIQEKTIEFGPESSSSGKSEKILHVDVEKTDSSSSQALSPDIGQQIEYDYPPDVEFDHRFLYYNSGLEYLPWDGERRHVVYHWQQVPEGEYEEPIRTRIEEPIYDEVPIDLQRDSRGYYDEVPQGRAEDPLERRDYIDEKFDDFDDDYKQHILKRDEEFGHEFAPYPPIYREIPKEERENLPERIIEDLYTEIGQKIKREDSKVDEILVKQPELAKEPIESYVPQDYERSQEVEEVEYVRRGHWYERQKTLSLTDSQVGQGAKIEERIYDEVYEERRKDLEHTIPIGQELKSRYERKSTSEYSEIPRIPARKPIDPMYIETGSDIEGEPFPARVVPSTGVQTVKPVLIPRPKRGSSASTSTSIQTDPRHYYQIPRPKLKKSHTLFQGRVHEVVRIKGENYKVYDDKYSEFYKVDRDSFRQRKFFKNFEAEDRFLDEYLRHQRWQIPAYLLPVTQKKGFPLEPSKVNKITVGVLLKTKGKNISAPSGLDRLHIREELWHQEGKEGQGIAQKIGGIGQKIGQNISEVRAGGSYDSRGYSEVQRAYDEPPRARRPSRRSNEGELYQSPAFKKAKDNADEFTYGSIHRNLGKDVATRLQTYDQVYERIYDQVPLIEEENRQKIPPSPPPSIEGKRQRHYSRKEYVEPKPITPEQDYDEAYDVRQSLRHVRSSEKLPPRDEDFEVPFSQVLLRHVAENGSVRRKRRLASFKRRDPYVRRPSEPDFTFGLHFGSHPFLIYLARQPFIRGHFYRRMAELRDELPIGNGKGPNSEALENTVDTEQSALWNPAELLRRQYHVDYNPLVEHRLAYDTMEGHMEFPNDENTEVPEIEKPWRPLYCRIRDGRFAWFASHCADEHPISDVLLTDTKITANKEDWTFRIQGGKENVNVLVKAPSNVFEKWRQVLLSQSQTELIDAYVQPAKPVVPHYQKKVLLLEIGAASVRAGVLTNKPSLPQCFFPAIALVTNDNQIIVGNEALAPENRRKGRLERPMDVADGAGIERYNFNSRIVDAAVRKVLEDLKIKAGEYKILLSISQDVPTTYASQLLHLLLEALHFQAATIARQPSLILYSYDVTTGVVVDIGETLHIVPVIDEYIVDSAIVSLPFGAQQIRNALKRRLQNSANGAGIGFHSPVEHIVLQEVVRQVCYVDSESTGDKKGPITVDLSALKLGEGFPTQIQVDEERHLVAEGLFNPKKWGIETKGIHHLIHEVIQQSPIDSRRTLYRNIYLAGGVSLLPGLAERLEQELSKIAPSSIFVQVHGSPWRYHAAYLGAQVIASSHQFDSCCADKDNINEYIRQLEAEIS